MVLINCVVFNSNNGKIRIFEELVNQFISEHVKKSIHANYFIHYMFGGSSWYLSSKRTLLLTNDFHHIFADFLKILLYLLKCFHT